MIVKERVYLTVEEQVQTFDC